MWLGCKVWTRREDEWIGERKIKEHGNRCKLEHEVYDIPADEGWEAIRQRTPSKRHAGQSLVKRKLLSSWIKASWVALHSGVLTGADIWFTKSWCSYCRLIRTDTAFIYDRLWQLFVVVLLWVFFKRRKWDVVKKQIFEVHPTVEKLRNSGIARQVNIA